MGNQMDLFFTASTKPPFWYPGSKGSATKKTIGMIPRKTKEIVSPFIGGGSIELALAARSQRVYAYDKQEALANCWKHILVDGKKLAEWCQKTLIEKSREELIEICKNDYKITDSLFEKAGYHWLRMSLTFRGIIAPTGHLCHYELKDGNAIYKTKSGQTSMNLTKFDRLEDFRSEYLTVNNGDFEESLGWHKDLFAYMDPPYPEAGSWLYGGKRELDSEFDHERLASVLNKRDTPFVLSYKDCDLIRELYPKDKFDWTYQDWFQQTAQTKRVVTEEVIIRPRKYLDYFKE